MMKKTIIASFLFFSPVVLRPAEAANCNITTTGAIQADDSVSGSPNLGGVYQIQGTITADYVNDDEVSPSTIAVTSPDGIHTVTSGLFILNAHANGLNTYAANIAAGYESRGVWVAGTWTWQINFQDLVGNTCTGKGSFTVSPSWNAGDGFLRSYPGTPNLYTDGNNSAFWGTGSQWYLPYLTNNGQEQYGSAEIPGSAFVNVNGTDVSWVSGTQFTTQTLPAGVYNQIYICPTMATCTYYGGVTINSATDMTLPSRGGTYSNVQAFLGFIRDLGVGSDHPTGYQASLVAAAQFYRQWGNTIDRGSDANGMPEMVGNWLGTGYNNYNWTTTGNSQTAWGLPAVDLWLAAAHAAGIHILLGGLSDFTTNPCPSFSCTSTELSNLQHYWAMLAARYGAFVDVWELNNESTVPQAWVDSIGTVLNKGCSGIDNGLPADPYGHLITVSDWPGYYSSEAYGPGTSTPDFYLTAIDMQHDDNGNRTPIYSFLSGGSVESCGSGPMLPSFQGEGPGGPAEGIGIAPSSQTVQLANDQTNGTRIVDAAYVMCQKALMNFAIPTDYFPINSTTPMVSATWFDYTNGRRNLQTFMQNLDATAAPLSVTLGGGCAGSACSEVALGSSSHVRLVLNSATGNSTTGVPNLVSGGTVTFSVPQANMIGQWWNPATGQIISTFTTASSAGRQTFTAPNFNVDSWLQLDAPPTGGIRQLSSAAGGVAALAPGSLAAVYAASGTTLSAGQPIASGFPSPTLVDGTTVTILDTTGASTPAPLLYVSAGQVNFLIPDSVALGPAIVTVTSGTQAAATGHITVTALAPALFTLNSSNLAAAYAECISSGGTETTEYPFQVVNSAIVAQPLNLSACAKTVLQLYATGLDKATAATVRATIGTTTATVQSAGPEGIWPGLDEVDVLIPASLVGAGNVPVVITAGGLSSNTVNVTIQ